MPGPYAESDNDDFDPQDQAEAFDEEALSGEAAELRTFEELPELMDMTRADGDRDDDEALALDADEFDPDAIDDGDLEEDDELHFRAATAEREDDLDGQGPDDGFDEAHIAADDIDGLTEVRDPDEAEGGEDDTTDYAARRLDDADLTELGYQPRKPA